MQPILKIDLSRGEISQFIVPKEWSRDFLGGASLAARILYGSIAVELDPLSPHASLLFLNGPLTGTAGPAVGRFVVCARSPATRLWGESNCGGFWGPELRMAGYDGLWITGCAEKPVYLWIKDDEAEIRSAEHLWGLDTYATQATIKAELSDNHPRIAVIGPAGEAQIPYALILTDHGRVAGRTGMGTIMGSKNLKAVAVEGSKKVPVLNLEAYMPLRSEANRLLRGDAMTSVLHDLGTAGVADYLDYLAEMPKHYFQDGFMEGTLNISGSNVAETILTGTSACHACVIACGRVVQLGDGLKRKGPEYETLVGFGPNLGITDPKAVTRLGELCDLYGVDTISMSNSIGLAFLLYERGIISTEHTGGLKLEWGNIDAVEKLIHQTIRREGLGYWLSRGSQGLGGHFGAEDEAVQVNGLEAAYHDPRGASGMALVYATSPRGACHNQSDYFLVDIGQVELSIGLESYERQGGAEKAANVTRHQDWRTICNALVLCFFANIPPEIVLSLINAACNLDWTMTDLLQCGERGWNLKRAINNRLGLNREHDRLPKSFLRPYKDDSANGFSPDIKAMLDAYYQARDWDKSNGYPSRQKLASLGLDWVVNDLWSD
jgi:aldehyde:ferredoxin oxidoreductase